MRIKIKRSDIKIRKTLNKTEKVFKDKKKYDRKEKHKRDLKNERV